MSNEQIQKNLELYNLGLLETSEVIKLQEEGIIPKTSKFTNSERTKFLEFAKGCNTYKVKISPEDITKTENLTELIKSQMYLIEEYITKYYYRKPNQKFDFDDYLQDCYLGLVTAIKNSKIDENYEKTVEKCITDQLQNSCLKLNNDIESLDSKNDGNLDYSYTVSDDEQFQNITREERKKLVLYVINSNSITERERVILTEYYGLNNETPKTMRALAEKFDVDLNFIKRILSNGLKHAREQLKTSDLDVLNEQSQNYAKPKV